MIVADVMSRGIDPVSPEATIQQAAIRMAEDDVGAVLVGSDDQLEGILTDRDIILRVVVDGLDVTSVRVRDVMSSTLFTCNEMDPVADALKEMTERQVRRLPVLDSEGRPIGLVTLSDLGKRGRDPGQATEILREIAEPHRREARPDKGEDAGTPQS
ncbi:CBS domain-containing protein [Rhodoligotrophos defluvii]|uniref:CBS domain-containing protein n=1 Tax=Rhodoligotrophos defluvii TaxID=2561934 RepID=UPI0010C9547D|nr:CBS domain-containing protein [Rhodoligotrophos defluvii]